MHQAGFICKIIQRCTVNKKNIKISYSHSATQGLRKCKAQEKVTGIEMHSEGLYRRVVEMSSLSFNPLNPELNPICYLLALLGAHHFLHVSRIRVKLLTLRLLMSYIYMEHPFLMFLDHTQRRSTVGRTPLDE